MNGVIYEEELNRNFSDYDGWAERMFSIDCVGCTICSSGCTDGRGSSSNYYSSERFNVSIKHNVY
jgi:heterodisulfide reductase subunit C